MKPAISPELQTAQDMLQGIMNQRNAAQNECVQLAAQLQAANRKIQELEAKLGEDAELPFAADAAPVNGHDVAADHEART